MRRAVGVGDGLAPGPALAAGMLAWLDLEHLLLTPAPARETLAVAAWLLTYSFPAHPRASAGDLADWLTKALKNPRGSST